MLHRSCCAAALMGLTTWSPLAGQIGVTTDIITGVVVAADGAPLPNVIIEVLSLETEITRRTTTDARGRYSALFPDGGGQYQVTARLIGMMPQQTTLVRYADEDRLVWDVVMQSQAVMLDEIVVQGFLSPVRIPNQPTPGSASRNFTADLLASLPFDVADLNLLATLVPGVVGVDATDSTGAAFSVDGLRDDANALTLDGMTFGAGNVPQDGLRNTRVITSTYDVSRGRFSGGLIASTTRSGSQRVQGSANYALRDDALAFETGEPSPFTSAFTQHRVSGGLGGPLVGNRLFVFGSVQGRFRQDPSPTLTSATGTDLLRLGLSPDSVARFVSLVDQVGASPGQRIDRDRSNDNVSTLVRFDYLISNDHTLTVRSDWRTGSQEPSRLGQLSLPETGGENDTNGGGMMASLASRIGLHFLNEARAYISRTTQDGTPYLTLPHGRVQVASELGDGVTGIATLSLGGNLRMPMFARSTMVQLSDELSWLPGRGTHRFKFGAVLTAERSSDLRASNQFGTYTFNSLADLAAGTAASFRRTVGPAERVSEAVDYALYAGDVWRLSPTFQFTYGVRMEGTNLFAPPAYNPALETAFGRRTDELPSEMSWSPRAGFSWTVGGGAGGFGTAPLFIVRGGAGLFRSPVPNQLIGLAQASTGLPDSELEINCIGAAVPAPDWNLFTSDPSAIPNACAGPSTPTQGRAPIATVFADDFAAPKSFRASLGVQRNLSAILRVSVDARYARGLDQYGYRDLNLDATPGFGLAAEGGRPVYVAASRINPNTGAVNLNDSRIDPAFGQVLEVDSHLESETKQVSLALGGVTRGGIVLQTSYTWSHVRDQSSTSLRGGGAGFGSNTTAANPNEPEWSRGSFERRHAFLATVRYPFGPRLEVTAIGRLNAGTPYTPLVGRDINGDGSRNDRAFVFPTSAADPQIAAGMTALLNNTSFGALACLRAQFGSVAERNSCTGPWQGTLDFQVNYRPRFVPNLSLSLTTVNFLRGLDELIHGSSNAKGWGLGARPDPTLLFVEGFDPALEQYQYRVNERFGATNPSAQANRSPFQIGVQARIYFGPNRGQAALDRIRGGGRGGGGRAGMGGGRGGRGGFGGLRGLAGPAAGATPDDFLERFLGLLPNPPALVLAVRDSVNLTADQVAQLEVARDSLAGLNEELGRGLQEELAALATNQDPRATMALIRPATTRAREHLAASVGLVREILTADQWEALPEQVRNIGRARAGGPRRRGNGS